MNVLLLNGSPHQEGCVFTALSEIKNELEKHGAGAEIFWIGNGPVRGCIGCNACGEKGVCAFSDPVYDACAQLCRRCDALVVGSPVYYAGPNGSLCAFLDRLFYSLGNTLRHKPAACVVNCRRGGASAAFDRLNKYFTINEMPVVSSQYWNSTHGFTPDEVRRDLEGLQTMRTLARNLVRMLRGLRDNPPLPVTEQRVMTNFIAG